MDVGGPLDATAPAVEAYLENFRDFHLARVGIMCERCRTLSAMEVLVFHQGEEVATLVGCQQCRTGVCADKEAPPRRTS
jgi:hypothetical protein